MLHFCLIGWLACFSLCADSYDTSFSTIMDDVYQKYHTQEGDWCDLVREQISGICTAQGGSVSYLALQEGGVDPDYLDLMALECAKKYSDTFLALVWPRTEYAFEPLVREVLENHCTLIYHKKFTLKGLGPQKLLFMIPEKMAHPSHYPDYFPKEMSEYPMMCFVVRAGSVQDVIQAKYAIRKLLKIDPFCIHFNDTHSQCLDLAHMVLNNNSIHFLNHHNRKRFENFTMLFEKYNSFLKEHNYLEEDFCIDGSSVLAAYGIRDSAVDFDFLSTKYTDFEDLFPLDHHNEVWERLGLSVNEVIYNPKCFFFFNGQKFASLETIRAFKLKQGRVKDLKDVSLIDNLLKGTQKRHIPKKPEESAFGPA